MQALAVSSSVGSGGGGLLAAAGGQTAAGRTGDWIIKADKAEVMAHSAGAPVWFAFVSSHACLCALCSLASSFLLTVSTS